MAPVIELVDVHKRYRIYRERYRSLKEVLFHRGMGEWEDHPVLRGVDLEIAPGRTVGIIGHNGAGKSTLLKLMSRILVPDRGTVSVRGRVSGLLELGAGFQPDYTGRENIYLNASLLGLSNRDVNARFDDMVSFAELEEQIDTPLRTYSSGMHMRLGFSVAIHVNPEVLIVDEVMAVGDEAFQHKCMDWIEGFQRAGGTIVLVSHGMASVRDLCDDVVWLEDGRVRMNGDPATVVDAYVDHVRDDMRAREEESHGPRAGEVAGTLPAVELGEVRLLDRNGQPVYEIDPGSPLTVDIPYTVHQPVSTPVFGVAIHRNDGVLVYATNTDVDGLSPTPLTRDGRVRLTYSELGLLEGTFRVTVALFPSARRGETPLDAHGQRYAFRVRGARRLVRDATKDQEQGVSRLDHRWEGINAPIAAGFGD